jgi:para-aminobenzoate synthetase component 1
MIIPKIKNVHTKYQKLNWDAIMTRMDEMSSWHSFACLLSGTQLDCANRIFWGVNPFLIVQVKNKLISLKTTDRVTQLEMDVFQLLKQLFHTYHDLNLNYAGAIGYFSYECGHYTETLPKCIDNESIDDIVVCFYSTFFDYQISEQLLTQYDFETNVQPFTQSSATKNKQTAISSIHQHIKRSEYIQKLHRVIDYIREGDIYQANISHKFTIRGEFDGYHLFKRLFSINPAPFFAYLNVVGIEIISSSPERFIVCNGNHVETRPIKGTISRGKSLDEDHSNRKILLKSIKDAAELAMIVDLLRNDLGKISCPGSVKVQEFKRVEPYNNVYHLIAIVDALMESSVLPIDVIKAVFPGGSITGCPKIRSMEIISEIEQETRGIYTGSIFFHSFGQYFDSNIAIRTMTIKDDLMSFRVGGGIVYDSIPENEYNETIYKGQSILQSLGIDYTHYLGTFEK